MPLPRRHRQRADVGGVASPQRLYQHCRRHAPSYQVLLPLLLLHLQREPGPEDSLNSTAIVDVRLRPGAAPWWASFYPRDAVPARVLAMALCPCLCLCLSVCPSQVGVLSKGMDVLICFLALGLLLTSPTLCFKETRVSTKIRVFSSGTFSYALDSTMACRSSNVLST